AMANVLARKHAAGAPWSGCRDCVGLGASLRRVRHRADLGLLSAGHSGEALGQSTGHRVVGRLSVAVGVLSRGDAAALDPRPGFAPPGLVLSPMRIDYSIDRPVRLEVDFEVEGFTILLGQSGEGKTTLLRAVAGLLPARGEPFGGLLPQQRAV